MFAIQMSRGYTTSKFERRGRHVCGVRAWPSYIFMISLFRKGTINFHATFSCLFFSSLGIINFSDTIFDFCYESDLEDEVSRPIFFSIKAAERNFYYWSFFITWTYNKALKKNTSRSHETNLISNCNTTILF